MFQFPAILPLPRVPERLKLYGSFSLIEVFTDKLISWFPMYYHMKFAFLVWLQLPSTNDNLSDGDED
ncbi:hypothetical protein PIB30_055738 [Stylosanthes scabra]|uniref:HVA22-like protein n=1 Tax=Stylosanthes scabra TaxID=79078 RepID=A0ABU6RJH7_9FABA|nr:hypothetical protein [Stylosanthes scabra]